MSNTTTTVYMNLSLPIPTVEIGPAYAIEIVAAMNAVDAHDHTSGKGKPIPSSAFNINANINFLAYAATNLATAQFINQSAALTGASYASGLQVVGGNLYFINGSGSAVQITSGGALVSTPGTVNSLGLKTITTNLTILSSDTYSLINVNNTAPASITLPSVSAVLGGRFFAIKDGLGNSFTQPLTLLPNGTDTIDLASSLVIRSTDATIWLASDGVSNWVVI